jgi:gamma-glutamylcyclotransferase (GGCT)/AIG2-like uncharacterized protein YtfP
MSVAQMRTRCPAGRLIGVDRLDGWRFFINQRGVASVRREGGGVVHGAVWRLTGACLASLDTYEGVVEGRYRRDRVTLASGRVATIYIDPRGDGNWRKPGYVELIVQAAAELELDANYSRTLAGWLDLPNGPLPVD